MSAGFSYNLSSPMIELCKKETNGICQTRELMKYLAIEPLLFEPGERWEYSLCHDVLAALVEVLSGVRFGEYVKSNIFEPMKMFNSTFLLDDSELDRVCSQYKGEGIVLWGKNNAFKFGSEYESGGAGCISTVEDYIKFLEGLRTGKLLNINTLKLMSTNQMRSEQLEKFWLNKYGYGLGVRCKKDDESISDFGWAGAAGSYLIIDLENEYTAFYAQHVLESFVLNYRDEILSLIKEDIKKYGNVK
jgi:CubicO group peptidase (beta-lactamase class C family)